MIDAKTRKIIVKILKKNGVKRAAVFGSFARGEEKKRSDIDILVEPPKEMSFFGFVRLERELKEAVQRKIDLVTYNSLNPLLEDIILSEQKPILYG